MSGEESNVTPMVPIHRCASCGELVEHDKRFETESHSDVCRQPEIRMRRLEARVYFLEQLVAGLLPKDDQNASPPEPETQRSPSYRPCAICGRFVSFDGPCAFCETRDRLNASANASAGAAEREAPAGAVPTGAAGGDSGPGEGDARAPEGGD